MKTRVPKRPSDPELLQAIRALEAAGWNPERIRCFLGFSLRTYYRRKNEIEAGDRAVRRVLVEANA